MAKRVNYSFGKRQKEIKRQQKKDEKAAKKLLKKEAAGGADQPEIVLETDEQSALLQDSPADKDHPRDQNA